MSTMQQDQQNTPDAASIRKRSIIDCDLHLAPLRGGYNALKPYLPRFYREQVETWGARVPGQNAMYNNGGINGSMQGRKVPPGDEAVMLDFLRADLLDKYNIEHGIITGMDYGINTTPDTEYAAAICSACNDYTIEHILDKEPRFKASIMIPKQDPVKSAREIDRVGSHPGYVQVIVSNGADKPYGHRHYYPIYEACVRHNMPFGIHVSMEGIGINPPPTGAGYVSHYAEYRLARAGIMMTHLASFIYEGVFELFPTLKVVMIEAGTLWIAPAIWRMDEDWKALRHHTPWVKKRPSEYYREHVRVTSQPIEMPHKKDMFLPMLEAIHADECLMFSSDYPHWDFDSPVQAFPKLPDELRERIFYQNAAELYGLPQRADNVDGGQG
ncbi:amidohydrolase [Paenibacillus hemerocallicola]|uniref:Amidohydrolase n=1 Tax=Paenibacillus hemerocallicola TaxID=1172614 RepID=A0A5C4T1B0_9BACL|nr:amidohydrolase family protein [Paenibacillus hemerocallicola]TNJ62804.1 amidohydrolase [Paenibacillus hemerocallicola]